jgi:PAS domain S-box-containing protein
MSDKRDLDERVNSGSDLRDAAEEKLGKSLDAPQELKYQTPEEIIHELRVHKVELEMQNEELKRIQLVLEASTNKYEELYDFAPVGYFTLTPKGLIAEVNLTGAALLGMPRPKLIGRGFGRFVSPKSLDLWNKHIISVLGHEDKQTSDLRLKREDESSFYARLNSIRVVVPNEQQEGTGETHLIRMAVTDVTDWMWAEKELRESEERYRTVADFTYDWEYWVDAEGNFLYVSPSCQRITGYSTKEFIDDPDLMTRIIHPDDRTEMLDHYHKVRKVTPDAVNAIDFRIIRRDGATRWIGHVCQPVYDQKGQISGRRAGNRDITERKRAEEEIQQSEERYRSLVEDSFDGIFIQKGFKIVFANSRLYEMLGYSPGELEGMDHWLVYHPDDQDLIRQRAVARVRGEKVISQYEVMLRKKDGASFPAEISARLVQIDGEIGIQIWLRDISGRRRSEEAQKRLATAIEQSIESVMITDRNGKIQYINPAFERISGYRKEEVIGRDTRFLKSDRLDSSFYKDQLTAIRSGKPWKGRLLSQKKDGQIFYEDVAISPVRDSSGEIINFVDVGHDVTENVELQMQLLQAQKMEAIGTLAGGIAHDFNNLLQIVLGYSEVVLLRKKEGEHDYADLQQIYQAGKRGADLVKSLMTFSRKVETKLVPVNLNQEITQVQHLLSNTIPKTINITLHLNGNLDSIKADPSQIGQVLMNLGVNARDAMADGGILTFETLNVQLDKEYCDTHLEAKPGSYILLTVSDTGQGMDRETLSHIFEPFFSTKEVGKGTGLGLATVYGIVKQHGGHITCYSEPGLGTTFNIYLPTIEKERDSEAPTVENPIPGGTETILLVDDEEALRELGSTLLNEFGYKVITANDGKQALDIYQREGDHISLIILDLIMPVMDGKKCLEEILLVNPNTKVVMASGFSEAGTASGVMAAGAKGFVQKPYDMRQLLSTVREVLDKDVTGHDNG